MNATTTTEPPPAGKSPRQTQKNNKGSSTAKPKGTATKPRRLRRLVTKPPSPPSAKVTRARARTVNKQVIGNWRNSVKQASRKRIATLICIQKRSTRQRPRQLQMGKLGPK